MALFRIMASLAALAGSFLPAQAADFDPDWLVVAFERTMHVSTTPETIEPVAMRLGLRTVGKDFDGPHLVYLEMTDPSEKVFIVYRANVNPFKDAFTMNSGDLIVTRCESDRAYYEALKRVARNKLPDGPSHKLVPHDIPVEGIAWGADYPGLINLEVKYFAMQSASQIQAKWLRTY